MWRRIRQFKDGLFARCRKSDYTWLADFLTDAELAIFRTLPRFDQRHSVDVALELARRGVSLEMVRAGILHDIGKAGCPELTLVRRSLCVICERIAPKQARVERRRGKLGRALFVHQRHAAIGADLLGSLGCTDDRIVWIVRHHDDKTAAAGDEELAMLMEVDDAM